MDALLVAANSKGIPYDAWIAIWVALTVFTPILAVVAIRRHRGEFALLSIAAWAFVAATTLGIASRCHSFGLYPPGGCSAVQSTIIGWLVVGAAVSVDAAIAVHLTRTRAGAQTAGTPPPRRPDLGERNIDGRA